MQLRLEVYLFLLSWFYVYGQDDCLYHFTQEPLENLHCNPYTPKDEIRIECSVSGTNVSSFQWWWLPTGNTTPSLLQEFGSEIRIQPFNTDTVRRSRIQVQNLSSRTGTYWCQPVLQDGTRLEESNRLYLADERQYVNEDLINCGNPESEMFWQTSSRCILSLNGNDDSSSPDTPSNGDEQATTSPTVTTPFNQTSPSNGPDRGLGPALYSVIAVIAVFCLVIITLTVIIVTLYRRKCARADIKTVDAEMRASNPYSGFTKERERLNGVSNGVSRDPHTSLTSSTHSTRPHHVTTHSPAPHIPSSVSPQESTEEPYSRLVHSHSISGPSRQDSIASGYSKLTVGDDAPPPHPPKPSATLTSLLASSSSQQRVSRIYSDLDDQDLEGGMVREIPSQEVPRVDIYNTLEGPGRIGNGRAAQPDYEAVIPRRGGEKSKSTNLFDDPGYSPLKASKKEKQFEVVDPRYTGDYERSPEYTCPTIQLSAKDVDPKYRGDYERDPNYIPKPPPRRGSVGSNQTRAVAKETVALRRQSVEVDTLSKYRGNYERDPNYVPSPLRVMEEDKDLLDHKYSGNYERNPVYMASLVKKAREERASSAEYSYPYTDAFLKEDGVVSPHDYATLEEGSGNTVKYTNPIQQGTFMDI